MFFVLYFKKRWLQSFYFVRREAPKFVFFVTWSCWKTQKKVFLRNKSCSQTNYDPGVMEPKFEGSESLGNRKRFRFFLVILTLNAKKLQTG